MRQITLLAVFLFSVIAGFSQASVENGTIYIKHPYIDAVNKTTEAYLDKDMAMNVKLYSDTAKW
ncbi:MAG: hypothetical protein KGM16_02340 [Bacteroidota bacterium]|nr:hypothetical protein [Bacteroidota bacterium]